MSNFSDKEDKMLIQLMLQTNDKSRISWSRIANRMRTKKLPEQLRLRVNKLKQRFGTDFAKCPAWYMNKGIVQNQAQTESTTKVGVKAVKGTTEQTSNKENDSKKKDDNKGEDYSLVVRASLSDGVDRRRSCDELMAILASLSDDDTSVDERRPLPSLILPGFLPDSKMKNSVIDSDDDTSVNAISNPPRKALRRRSKQRTTVWIQSHNAVWNIFAPVKKKDILQPSGKMENNAGELTPQSISNLIKVCDIGELDVFADIGSGVGNVVAQVALETFAQTVIGVEIRSDLAGLGESLMKKQTSIYPSLNKIKIYPQDICNVDIVNDSIFQRITVLYCHNTLFKPEVLHVLEYICCRLRYLRTVVIQLAFCPRHRDGCMREFCLLFKRRSSLFSTNVTFKASQVHLQIYDRVKK